MMTAPIANNYESLYTLAMPNEEHPDDLITIAEASRLVGRSISTIATLASMGRLRTSHNPEARNPRRGARLVSRSEVLARYSLTEGGDEGADHSDR